MPLHYSSTHNRRQVIWLGEQVKQVALEISMAFGYSLSYPSHNADQMV